MQTAAKKKILVIKLSALGDFIQALGPMQAIRNHHKDDDITLMTTKPFKTFGEKSGYFNNIFVDERPKITQPIKWLNLRKNLISGEFDRVYDLQNNDRTQIYFNLFPKSKRPEWVGAAKGASHENKNSARKAGTALEGHKMTLALAGINNVKIDTLDWLKDKGKKFDLPKSFVLLVTGCAPQHPQKRWPAENYAALGQALVKSGFTPVLIGTKDEKEINDQIMSLCPQAINLTEKTSLFDIAALAHNADFAIGNDTGPMHMTGPTGCKTLALFSAHSTPSKHAPNGENVFTLQKDELKDLSLEDVKKAIFENMGIKL